MDEITTRCNVYNRANGTNLTPKEFYKLGLDNVVEADKVAAKEFKTTIGIERNVKKQIMRKL